jgi:hypothetical protein
MAGREWTDEEVQAEISAAVKMVAEDRERAEYNRLHGLYGAKPDGDDKGDGKTPPPKKDDKKDGPPEGDGKKRRSVWWGEQPEDPAP